MNTVILGLQWGDEGKGKAIDYLARDFDVVVRFQGGHNAGHTIYLGEQKVILHLLPSGIFTPNALAVIGSGVVVHPLHLVEEIRQAQRFPSFDPRRLVLSDAAPLILPFHQQLDIVFEESRYFKIGTTRRGIGPAYEDVTGRRSLFVRDLLNRDRFIRKLRPLSEYYNKIIQTHGGQPLKEESFINDYLEAGAFLKTFAADSVHLLHRLWAEGQRILFEGAQGALLDIGLGTYPYVTSSHPTIGGVLVGTGLSHKAIGKVIGISKAYTTRVGEGPFPSELASPLADRLREKGDEYGSTTGRPRRVGWLDLVALKYAIMINGTDALFLTKLDVLDDFATIKVAVAYHVNGRQIAEFPNDVDLLSRVKPVYKSFPGWKRKTSACRNEKELPKETRAYLHFIEEQTGVPVEYVSVGSGRDQTIHR